MGHLVGDEDLEVEGVVADHVVGVDHDPVAEDRIGRSRLDRRGGDGGHPRQVARADQPLGLGLVAGDEDHRLALPAAGPGVADLGVGAVGDPQQPPGQGLLPGMVDDQGAGAAHGLHLAAVPDLDVVAAAHPAVAGAGDAPARAGQDEGEGLAGQHRAGVLVLEPVPDLDRGQLHLVGPVVPLQPGSRAQLPGVEAVGEGRERHRPHAGEQGRLRLVIGLLALVHGGQEGRPVVVGHGLGPLGQQLGQVGGRVGRDLGRHPPPGRPLRRPSLAARPHHQDGGDQGEHQQPGHHGRDPAGPAPRRRWRGGGTGVPQAGGHWVAGGTVACPQPGGPEGGAPWPGGVPQPGWAGGAGGADPGGWPGGADPGGWPGQDAAGGGGGQAGRGGTGRSGTGGCPPGSVGSMTCHGICQDCSSARPRTGERAATAPTRGKRGP